MSLRAIIAGMALALTGFSAHAADVAATEYGKSLPPVGFVKFCAENPADCKTLDDRHDRLEMTPDRWNLVYQVNTAWPSPFSSSTTVMSSASAAKPRFSR